MLELGGRGDAVVRMLPPLEADSFLMKGTLAGPRETWQDNPASGAPHAELAEPFRTRRQ